MTDRPRFAALRLGDLVIMPMTVRRRWWQFWKPREWREDRTFKVSDVIGGDAGEKPPQERTRP
jgi:hypothetical protein